MEDRSSSASFHDLPGSPTKLGVGSEHDVERLGEVVGVIEGRDPETRRAGLLLRGHEPSASEVGRLQARARPSRLHFPRAGPFGYIPAAPAVASLSGSPRTMLNVTKELQEMTGTMRRPCA